MAWEPHEVRLGQRVSSTDACMAGACTTPALSSVQDQLLQQTYV
jgi:hypothetical protein